MTVQAFQRPKINYQNRILSESEFWQAVQRESLRSERHQTANVLIQFRVKGEKSKNIQAVQYLSNTILYLTRSTDWIGEANPEDGCIYVLLTDTTDEEALKYIARIEQFFRKSDSPLIPDLEVRRYSMPQEAIPDFTHPQPEESLQKPAAFAIPIWKRATDILVSSLLLIASAPVFLFLALFIKVVSPGSVFYRQMRICHYGQPFVMWKFRTMHVMNNENIHKDHVVSMIRGQNLSMTKLEDDPRLIPYGSILRASYLDELPQLINVFLGHMSLVGPRPTIPYEYENYESWHKKRHLAVPGMTGLWQVSGKNKLTFNQMVRLDIDYAHKQSIGLDIYILVKTPIVIVKELIEKYFNKVGK